MIRSITSILRKSASDPNIKVTVFTGSSDYFTSGNDLSNFMSTKLYESFNIFAYGFKIIVLLNCLLVINFSVIKTA